ncbi:unnamed protein product [Effrenium voratum]|nr:unnamed protein product [Effrenium voratum]
MADAKKVVVAHKHNQKSYDEDCYSEEYELRCFEACWKSRQSAGAIRPMETYGPHERRVHHSRGRKKRDVQREDRDVRLPKAPMLPCRVGMARNGQLSGFHFF